MNARLGVKKYLRGGELKYDPAEFNYITVYDMGAKGYRMVNANTIQNLKIGKNEYIVPTAVSESEEPQLNEAFNPFLDTEEGGYMREYIDSIAEEEGLDLSYRSDFDEAFSKALQQLQSENIYPELDFKAIKANKEIFF